MSVKLPTPFLPTRGVIRSRVELAPDNVLFEICFDAPGALSNCLPGQFVEIWLPGVGECPISVCSGRRGNIFELCVRKVGRVTDALFKLEEGDWLGVRGPYGNGFPVDTLEGQNIILVAGGLGIAPIRSLLQHILDKRDAYGQLILIYGMRHSELLLFRQECKVWLRRQDMAVFIAAEEVLGPSVPPQEIQLGRVTDMMRLAQFDTTFHAALCGPPVMYKYAVQELLRKGVVPGNIWLSLERHMKCGIGKCGHCIVGGRFTCMDGPVFNLNELRMLPEAVESG